MSLLQVGKFNNLSEGARNALQENRPPKGSIITYRSLLGSVDPFSPTKKQVWPAEVGIPPISRYYDSYAKNPQWIEVGLVSAVDEKGKPDTVKKHYWQQMKNVGNLHITIGTSAEMDALYDYLQLASFVANNDGRDKSVTPIMEKADFIQEAAGERAKRKLKSAARNFAENIKTYPEVQRAALILGINADQDEEILRDQIEIQAEASPETFLEKMKDDDGDSKALVSQAVMEGVLNIDMENSILRYTDNKVDVMRLAGTSMPDVQNQFAAMLKGQKDGGKMMTDMLKKLIDKKIKAKQLS